MRLFNEGMDVGTLVGVLSATDADTDDLLRMNFSGEIQEKSLVCIDANEVCTVPRLTTRRMQPYAIRARTG